MWTETMRYFWGHAVCLSQWVAFSMVYGACLGRGKFRFPVLTIAGIQLGMLVFSYSLSWEFFGAIAILYNLLYLVLTVMLFGGTVSQKMMAILINGVMCLLTENAVTYLYAYCAHIPADTVWHRPTGVLCYVAANLFSGILVACAAKRWWRKQQLEPLQMLVTMFFPGVVVVLNLVLMISGERLEINSLKAVLTIGLTVAILAHIQFVEMFDAQVIQKRSSEYQASLQQEQAEALMESYTTQRRLTHEFANHMEALALMLRQGDKEGAQNYLEALDKNIRINSAILNSRNPLLDALLSKKYEEASAKGIAIYFDLSDLRDIPLDNTDLVIVVSNLLNNAMEASAWADRPEIYVRARRTKNEFLLSVRNRVQKDVTLTEGELPHSSKREHGHGMGLANVCGVIRKHNGEYTISCRDHWFRFTCAVPICKI